MIWFCKTDGFGKFLKEKINQEVTMNPWGPFKNEDDFNNWLKGIGNLP
jgi:hypothetical protein